MKAYNNPNCMDLDEFQEDLKRIKYIKRLFKKYLDTGSLRTRLIINHIIVLANVFGVDAATTLLFFKIERNHWPILKAFLVFLQYMPENDLIDVQINHEVMGKLGQI